jgi:hypothetical protein
MDQFIPGGGHLRFNNLEHTAQAYRQNPHLKGIFKISDEAAGAVHGAKTS